ncbi:MAG: Fe-S cluster assembly protein SufD [Bacteroidales bacterium]|nr:Fe-S cluster assembly protein SufD [Bacteroidales bacterium]
MTTLELQEELAKLYNKNASHIAEDTSELINKHRQQAFEDFKRLGIPSKKNEDYRYTDLMSYLKGEYSYEIAPSKFSVDLDDLFRCDIPELDTFIVLVLNGFYYKQNNPVGLPEGVIISSFAKASIQYPEIVNRHYAKYADTKLDSLAALNTLFAQDGIFIYIPKNIKIDKPIQIINIGFSFKNLRITRRNLFVIEQDSSASLLICDHTLCPRSFITNSLTEIYTGDNASFNVIRMQNENGNSSQISNTFVYQEANSRFSSNTISLHGGLIRNNTFAKLNGEGALNKTYGIFFGDNDQHVANYTHIHHAKPHCESDQLFKGILDGNSTGAFNGKILVDKFVVKTQAYQRNNNILLSKTARMNTKPQLEIYNDDVKCSHGATVGQLDENALFYLRSRGISNQEARHLLMYAFADEVIADIKLDPLRQRMNEMIEKRLRGELARCENCKVHHLGN